MHSRELSPDEASAAPAAVSSCGNFMSELVSSGHFESTERRPSLPIQSACHRKRKVNAAPDLTCTMAPCRVSHPPGSNSLKPFTDEVSIGLRTFASPADAAETAGPAPRGGRRLGAEPTVKVAHNQFMCQGTLEWMCHTRLRRRSRAPTPQIPVLNSKAVANARQKHPLLFNCTPDSSGNCSDKTCLDMALFAQRGVQSGQSHAGNTMIVTGPQPCSSGQNTDSSVAQRWAKPTSVTTATLIPPIRPLEVKPPSPPHTALSRSTVRSIVSTCGHEDLPSPALSKKSLHRPEHHTTKGCLPSWNEAFSGGGGGGAAIKAE